MSLVNSKVRFAVDEEDGRVFCYLTGRYFLPTGILTAPDGVWDLAKVKAAILAGDFIDGARIAPAVSPDAVAKANADFEAQIELAKSQDH
jgi:hypothetical protein